MAQGQSGPRTAAGQAYIPHMPLLIPGPRREPPGSIPLLIAVLVAVGMWAAADIFGPISHFRLRSDMGFWTAVFLAATLLPAVVLAIGWILLKAIARRLGR